MRHPSPALPQARLRPAVVWPGYAHPWCALAVAVLLLNDHVLKGAGLVPTWLTGKLSDLAGLFFFPLLLLALLHATRQLLLRLRRRRPPRCGEPGEAAAPAAGPDQPATATHLSRHELALACLLTALAFAAIQLLPLAAVAFASALDSLTSVASLRSRAVVMDTGDLLALPAVVLAYLHGARFLTPGDLPPRG